MNKYKAITDWLMDYSLLYSWIYFNVIRGEADTLSLNSVPNERELVQYINGDREVELLFALDLVKEYDIGTSDINLEANEEFENISNWIEEQNNNGNYPDFGENIKIEEVEVLETTPSVIIDSQNNLAKYQGQYRITYIERRT